MLVLPCEVALAAANTQAAIKIALHIHAPRVNAIATERVAALASVPEEEIPPKLFVATSEGERAGWWRSMRASLDLMKQVKLDND